MIWKAVALLVAAGTAGLGCAPQVKLTYSQRELHAEMQRRAAGIEQRELVAPFEVAAEQVFAARQLVNRTQIPSEKASLLIGALVGDSPIGLRYAEVSTETAQETLRRGEGNCMALSSVIVGLARKLGLVAHYVDLSHRREHVEQQSEFVVRSGHIGAVIRTELGFGGIEVGRRWLKNGNWRRISDLEATAHFHNNRGYDLVAGARAAGDAVPWAQVERSFWIATRAWPDFSAAWNNLGVAVARQGRADEARHHYRTAARLAPDSAAPWSNLGSLHLRSGELDRAVGALRAAQELDGASSTIAYKLGVALLRRGNVEEAHEWLDRAVRAGANSDPAQQMLDKLRLKYGLQGPRLSTHTAMPGGSVRSP
jgi:hypothetical protein